jgi:hypothetical protein
MGGPLEAHEDVRLYVTFTTAGELAVTRNARHYRRVPGLLVEDHTEAR